MLLLPITDAEVLSLTSIQPSQLSSKVLREKIRHFDERRVFQASLRWVSAMCTLSSSRPVYTPSISTSLSVQHEVRMQCIRRTAPLLCCASQ